MQVKTFFDENTFTFTHIIIDETTKKCAVLDSVMDYDQPSGRAATASADLVVNYIKENELDNEWILESHIHADHITAASYLQEKIGGKTGIGSGIKSVLELWVPKFANEGDTETTGTQFDAIFKEGDTFKIGSMEVTVWSTPGHTPACSCYLIADAIFVGDTMLAPHIGTARCDFPGGSSADLYKSVQRIYQLDGNTKIFLCHDYPKEGNLPTSVVTVDEAKATNVMINPDTNLEDYTTQRKSRDDTLAVPKLLFPSIQTNMRLGDFGTKSNNGIQYIKIPVNAI